MINLFNLFKFGKKPKVIEKTKQERLAKFETELKREYECPVKDYGLIVTYKDIIKRLKLEIEKEKNSSEHS